MCGIVIASGKNAETIVFNGLEKLSHRGRDSRSIVNISNELAFGFNRLAIQDLSPKGLQPFQYKDWIWVCNGEFYNYKLLKRILTYPFQSDSDSECLLPTFLKFHEETHNFLDGMFSGVLYNKINKIFYVFKDYLGIKPLFKVITKSNLIFCSELKVIQDEIISFESTPSGLTIYNIEGNIISQYPFRFSEKKINYNKKSKLKNLIYTAVKKRIPSKDIKTGVLLSGGVDSSIIALITSCYRKDVCYITVGVKGSEDIDYAKKCVDYLKLQKNHFIYEIKEADLIKKVKDVIYHLERFNPSNVTNGLMTYLASRFAANLGIKVLLCGEGADELFAGYRSFINTNTWDYDRDMLIQSMRNTELWRLDRMSMAYTIEAREPFLDKKLYSFASTLTKDDLIGSYGGKILTKFILRTIFVEELPNEILYRVKTPFDVGSGGRKLINWITSNYSLNNDKFCDYNGNISLEMRYYYFLWKKLFHNLLDHNKNFKDFGDYPIFMKFIEKRGVTPQ